jgi:hypothetical protein
MIILVNVGSASGDYISIITPDDGDICETSDINSKLIRLITQEDFIVYFV